MGETFALERLRVLAKSVEKQAAQIKRSVDDEHDRVSTIAEQVALVGEGTQGPPGPSAYQIAVSHGFQGTEAEWLASLSSATDPGVLDGGKI